MRYYIECLDSESQLLCEPIGMPATMATEMTLPMMTDDMVSSATPDAPDQSERSCSLSPLLSTTLPGTVGWFSSGWPLAYLIATVIFGIGLLVGSVMHVSQPVAGCQAIVSARPGGCRAEDETCRQDYGYGRLPVG